MGIDAWAEAESRRRNGVLAGWLVLGGLGCSAVVVADMVRKRPLPHGPGLLTTAILLLVYGAVRMRPVLTATSPHGAWRFNPVAELNTGLRAVFQTAFLGGVLAGITGIGSLDRGGPGTPDSGCPFPLPNHSTTVCVDETSFLAAQAAEQQSVAALVFIAFLVESAVLLGDALRERPPV